MKILYIFPHPDDESFGPAHVMSFHRRKGHEVYLLTLTRGGATKQRAKYGYSVEKMGEVRYNEMLNVAAVLDLSELKVLDFPDSGLKEMDPRLIEDAIKTEIRRIQPEVVVTYAVHGISGFHDHLVCHAVVKRAFAELTGRESSPKRLAFFTITEKEAQEFNQLFQLSGSKAEEIDCVMITHEVDLDNNRKALDCYVTFQEIIDKSGIRNHVHAEAYFEIYQEEHDPPLGDLFDKLPE